MHRTSVLMASISRELIGATGRRYLFEELLQERQRLGRVWTAISGQDKFVLKDIPKEIFSNFNDRILPRLRENTSMLLRLPFDTIPNQRILVYRYLTDDFLSLVREQIPIQSRRRILKLSLQALVELHERDVVHLDIKPDNIMVDRRHKGRETVVERVNVADLENAAYLPKGRCIKGMLAGNDNWRSPEAHFKGELGKSSDIFSFGLVCIYAVCGRVVCGPDEDFVKHESQGALPAMIRLQRQVSFFGDEDGLNGLMKHVGDEEVNCQVLSILWEERNADYIPYTPFREWPEADDEAFKDLVMGLTSLDPTKRLTAPQALEHPWFATTS